MHGQFQPHMKFSQRNGNSSTFTSVICWNLWLPWPSHCKQQFYHLQLYPRSMRSWIPRSQSIHKWMKSAKCFCFMVLPGGKWWSLPKCSPIQKTVEKPCWMSTIAGKKECRCSRWAWKGLCWGKAFVWSCPPTVPLERPKWRRMSIWWEQPMGAWHQSMAMSVSWLS